MTRMRMASDLESLPLSVFAVSEFRLVIGSPEQKKKHGWPPGGQPRTIEEAGPVAWRPTPRTIEEAGLAAWRPALPGWEGQTEGCLRLAHFHSQEDLISLAIDQKQDGGGV